MKEIQIEEDQGPRDKGNGEEGEREGGPGAATHRAAQSGPSEKLSLSIYDACLGVEVSSLLSPSLVTSELPSAMGSISLLTSLDSPTTLLQPLDTVLEQATIILLQDNFSTNIWRTNASAGLPVEGPPAALPTYKFRLCF